jgi:serine O-acetyltransferase
MRPLNLSLSEKSLENYVTSQICLFYPDNNIIEQKAISHCVQQSLKRLRICFDAIRLKYYADNRASYFNHLHGDHYSSFLYLMSNFLYKEGYETLASKFFLLNKAMFGIDAYYGITLPDHFLFVHPLGTVLGNGVYNDFLVVYQSVTVGATTDGIYPTFSGNNILYSNTSVIGDCKVGKNVTFSAESMVINQNINDSVTVLGKFPSNRFKENTKGLIEKYFII